MSRRMMFAYSHAHIAFIKIVLIAGCRKVPTRVPHVGKLALGKKLFLQLPHPQFLLHKISKSLSLSRQSSHYCKFYLHAQAHYDCIVTRKISL